MACGCKKNKTVTPTTTQTEVKQVTKVTRVNELKTKG